MCDHFGILCIKGLIHMKALANKIFLWVSSDFLVEIKFNMADDLLKKKTAMVRLNFFFLFFFPEFFFFFFFCSCYHCVAKYIFFGSGMWLIFCMVHSVSSSFVLKFWVHQELVKWLMSSFLNKYSKYILTSKQTSQWKPICYWNIFFDWFQRCIWIAWVFLGFLSGKSFSHVCLQHYGSSTKM